MLIGKIIGILFGIMGIFTFILEYLKYKRCTCEAEAVIADVSKEVRTHRNTHGSRRSTYYYPIVEFSTPERTVRVRADFKAAFPDT